MSRLHRVPSYRLWLATELDGAGANPARDSKEWRVLVKGDKIVLEGKGEKREYRFKLRSIPPNKGSICFRSVAMATRERRSCPAFTT